LAGDRGSRHFQFRVSSPWLNLTLCMAISTASSVFLGTNLGKGHARAAYQTVRRSFSLVLAVLMLTSLTIVVFAPQFAAIFSSDEAFQQQFAGVKVPFVCFLFTMCLATVVEGYLMALKKAGKILRSTLIGSWGGQVPAVFLLLKFYSMELSSVYYGVAIGYTLLTALYLWDFAQVDWDEEADKAKALAEGGAAMSKDKRALEKV